MKNVLLKLQMTHEDSSVNTNKMTRLLLTEILVVVVGCAALIYACKHAFGVNQQIIYHSYTI